MGEKGWKFQGEQGEFSLEQPGHNSYLYFPLVNEAGMMSAVTPNLHGGITSGHNTFLMEPVSAESLHNSKASRNFWVFIEGYGAWSVSGNSAKQNAARFTGEEERSTVEAGFLWHAVKRENEKAGLQAKTVSFVPVTDDKIELMQVTLTNTGNAPLQLTPTAAIPLYGRSADDLRDHRHVTSLLHRIFTSEYGIEVQPALSFDERGHRANKIAYAVLGAEGEGAAPTGFFPVAEDFIGEGGALDWPEAVVMNQEPDTQVGAAVEGYEAVGALRFAPVELAPGKSVSYVVAMIISGDRIDVGRYAADYLAAGRFDALLEQNQAYWRDKLDTIRFSSGQEEQDLWMKWVTLQPILRRLYGNSFLPYHDYGRGGRGWRDLWQDCLALMVMEPAEVRHLLLNNYAGVRMDGSNATIIGAGPGEFVADRNNIPRVWMDHGAWPLMTTLLYLHQSGDLDFLFQPQGYFRDVFVKRCRERDASWTPEQGNKLLTADGQIYEGTILEHILLQNIVPFFNVGEHGNIKLEGADWNDGLDLAPDRGESVAFTAFYASNLMELSELLLELQKRTGKDSLDIAEEMALLLDTFGQPIAYHSIQEKRNLLDRYYDAVTPRVSGRKLALDIRKVAEDLKRKADWAVAHLRQNEWIQSKEGYAWFNGYYNNDGERVEGDHPDGVRMTLTGQVFAIMGGVATDEQTGQISQAVKRYLKDERIGYRLNSRFGGIQQNLGRAFGFAFGHKENGAMFSHMTVMYANALYKRGFVQEGFEVLDSIYRLSADFENSRIYPGVPEYINERSRGMYTYLTGSASWLLLTQLTEVYGVKGRYGDLRLEPKLVQAQFNDTGEAAVETLFAGRMLRVVYRNPQRAEFGQYRVGSVSLDGQTLDRQTLDGENAGTGCLIPRARIEALPADGVHELIVMLDSLAQER
ncbi:GH36-type glycosyl hydrolase domain-containing protein [Paenibacillus macerans]|uniref:GH36-type glycosyl hydrolase domain-containing protein n=1 Tax=Paenibacillus macerans TaxID=44252 RepID=UPI0020405BF9|nr:cellobiose phosphorylase [Paenibacillus macerans]MCM3702505.1 cellobiose phosphorylase [Paenibacillus macerans]